MRSSSEIYYGDDFCTLEELKQFLKEYCFSTKIVHQLQGELGNAIQKDNENVITYANKIKELSMRIIDTYRVRNHPNEEQLRRFREETNKTAM